MVRELKKFRHMLSNNQIQLLVPQASVKDFLLKKDTSERRARWITKVMEFDLNIKITKLVRGKGLCEQFVSCFKIDPKVYIVLQEEE